MRIQYRQFLAGLRIKHFDPSEVISQADRTRSTPQGRVKNSIPPEELWDNMVRTLWIVDLVRTKAGKPISITSAFRNEAYNRACGGAKNSQHKQNCALDLIPHGFPPLALFNHLRALRDAGAFRGGLGLYSRRGFVHIDTRGRNATW